MKRLRSINTNVWDDVWFVELEPEEKLIWLYLLTNTLTNLIGIYEISKKKIQFDTGIESFERVSKALERFEKDGKAFYFSDHIILVNFFANQSYNTNMLTGAKNLFNELPNELIDIILGNPLKGFQRLRKGLAIVRKEEEEEEEEYEKESESESENELQSKKENKEILSLKKPIIKKRKPKPKPEPEIILPWTTETFKAMWFSWKAYKKKQHKFTFAAQETEQAALMHLSKCANGNEKTAIEIIRQSMGNGWKGLFELKNNNNGNQSSEQQSKQRIAEADAIIEQAFRKR
ncbi:MAG: hypothetical protein PHY21_10245 [Candidatus Cloacimonetes bacterium]|nr:hypothetical protein [Candidatus Cloacimonadota bacterium]